MKLRVFTAFSGYDSQCLALDRLKAQFPDFDYELVGWSEIDKYAIQAHNALFPQWADRNYGDISKINWDEVPDFDFFTYSFPCQDISIAGSQKGFNEGVGTRSSLLWECRKAIVAKKPKYLLLENVKGLVGKKFLQSFLKWVEFLNDEGYYCAYKVLNSRDYGVPQNRERTYLWSIRRDGLEPDPKYDFPQPFHLSRSLNDICDSDVDGGLYLSSERNNWYLSQCLDINNENIHRDEYMGLSRSRDKKGRIVKRNLNPYVNTLHTACGAAGEKFGIFVIKDNKIRNLSPKECFRLMGVDDKYIDKITKAVPSKTQQYKMAGNSIVVDTLYYLLKNMFCETQKLTLF